LKIIMSPRPLTIPPLEQATAAAVALIHFSTVSTMILTSTTTKNER